MATINRLAWAVDLMQIKPTDHILEIGCGAGKAIELITPLLTTGTVTGVDQSAAMIAKAAKNNEASIKNKKVLFLQQSFSDFKPGLKKYQLVFAFDVNIFWKEPLKELEIIKYILMPGGKLYLLHLPPVNKTKSVSAITDRLLHENGYRVNECIITNWKPVPAFCIIAEPL